MKNNKPNANEWNPFVLNEKTGKKVFDCENIPPSYNFAIMGIDRGRKEEYKSKIKKY